MMTFTIHKDELTDAAMKLGKPVSKKTAKLIVAALDVPITPFGLAQRMHLKGLPNTMQGISKVLKAMPEEYELLTSLGYSADPRLYQRLARCDLRLMGRILAAYPDAGAMVTITQPQKRPYVRKK